MAERLTDEQIRNIIGQVTEHIQSLEQTEGHLMGGVDTNEIMIDRLEYFRKGLSATLGFEPPAVKTLEGKLFVYSPKEAVLDIKRTRRQRRKEINKLT